MKIMFKTNEKGTVVFTERQFSTLTWKDNRISLIFGYDDRFVMIFPTEEHAMEVANQIVSERDILYKDLKYQPIFTLSGNESSKVAMRNYEKGIDFSDCKTLEEKTKKYIDSVMEYRAERTKKETTLTQ